MVDPGSKSTLPETNIAPENGWLEYEFPFGMSYLQGLNMLVLGSIFIYHIIM